MPLPLLLFPLAVAGGSALAQTVAKLKAHSVLNSLRAELQELESEHRERMQEHYDRQAELCLQLGLPEPELPECLLEPEPVEEPPIPRWRRPLKRLKPQKRGLADGPAQSRRQIVGKHAASFTAGTVWKTSGAAIMNVARPMLGRVLSIMPRFAAAGGSGAAGAGGVIGSLAASTAVRFALGAVTVVGIVVGPLLAGWAILREVKKVRNAREELYAARIERRAELTRYAVRTRQLERECAELEESAAANPVAVAGS